MRRSHLCVRPDCSAPADVALRYDYAERTVWLEQLITDPDPGVWGLCTGHADGLTVPHGWDRQDRRPLTLLPPMAPPLAV